MNALLGTANLILREVEEHYRARSSSASAPTPPTTGSPELFDGYHAERPEVPDDLSPHLADSPDFFGVRLIVAVSENQRRTICSAPTRPRGGHGWQRVRHDRRPRHVPVRQRPDYHPLCADRRPRRRGDRPAEVKRRYGVLPELVPDFIALRGDPLTASPARRASARKGAADLLKRHGSLEAALEGALRETKPRVRTPSPPSTTSCSASRRSQPCATST